jgi:hypothetical protein
MIFWPFCAFTWFKNIEKMPLQMTSGFLQLESTLVQRHKKQFVQLKTVAPSSILYHRPSDY